MSAVGPLLRAPQGPAGPLYAGEGGCLALSAQRIPESRRRILFGDTEYPQQPEARAPGAKGVEASGDRQRRPTLEEGADAEPSQDAH